MPCGLVAMSTQPPEAPVVPAPDELAAELDRRFTADVAPLLSTYCLSCHTGDDAKADLALNNLHGTKDILSGAFDLRLIREMVATGEMPPKARRQPSEHERLTITQWADAMLAYVPADAAIDPGWITPHRLNRAEYRNTLRDLLGVDPASIDLTAKLPRDDTGYGFDNVADVLSTSPLAVEQYVEAAERAIEVGLGPVVEFGDHRRSLAPLEGASGQPLPRGGFFLYSNGPAASHFVAPLTGDYLVRVRAWETPGGDDRARMSLRVGPRRVEEFTISGTRGEPQDVEARVRLTRGRHRVAAHFENDFYIAQQADRNLGVESITVAGPLDAATTERPTAWTSVFAPAAVAEHGESDVAARGVLGAFASKAYRRPATTPEIDALMKVYHAQRAAGERFEPSVRTALAATLVSPNFLFRTVAHPDAANAEARYTLSGYELAARLSYFLWSSTPDDSLLAAAADGALLNDDVLAAQARRMLADPKSAALVENFCGQWLQLRALEGIEIDRARFPEYDNALRSDMAEEVRLFFADVVRADRSVLDFVDARDTFVNERLAAYYGIPGVRGEAFQRVTLPTDSPRGGVLTMGAVLTLTSNTTRTSPVKRGLFVLDQILGTPPPPPPADIPPLEQSARLDTNATVRERLALHVANPTCAACHNRLDPLGLAFENFDAIGRWRDSENGRPIDASGTLPGGARLNGMADLKRTIMGRADEVVEALGAKMLTYALGRGAEPFDRPAVRAIARRTRERDDRFSALVESIVLSETFRTCRGRSITRD